MQAGAGRFSPAVNRGVNAIAAVQAPISAQQQQQQAAAIAAAAAASAQMPQIPQLNSLTEVNHVEVANFNHTVISVSNNELILCDVS